MSKIPFTVYDFFAYLSSGALVVASFDYAFGYQWLFKEKVSPTHALLLIFVAYLTGHVVAHFSKLILEDGLISKLLGRPIDILLGTERSGLWPFLFPGYFAELPTERRERVKDQAQTRNVEPSGDAFFQHAYAVVVQKKEYADRLYTFQNLYGFSRNMTVSLLFTSATLVVARWVVNPAPPFGWAILALAFAIVLLYRYLKFFRHFSYRLMLVYAELEQPKDDTLGSAEKGPAT